MAARRDTPNSLILLNKMCACRRVWAGGAALAWGRLSSGRAAHAFRCLLSRSHDLLGRLIRDLHGHLCKPAAVVDQELQIVPHQLALHRDEILRGTAAEQRLKAVEISLEPFLSKACPLPPDVLEAVRQHGVAFSHGLDVPRGFLGCLLALFVG